MMRYSILFIFSILVYACGNSPEGTVETEKKESMLPARDTSPIPAAVMPEGEIKPIDANWIEYWKSFQNAVANDGRSLMFSLVKFPLPGAKHLSSQIYDDKASQDDFRLGYFEIFDDFTKRAVAKTKAMDVESYTLVGDSYKGTVAEEIGAKEGGKFYKFKVGIVTKTDAGQTAMGFDSYHFAKFGNGYKLAWIEVERPESE